MSSLEGARSDYATGTSEATRERLTALSEVRIVRSCFGLLINVSLAGRGEPLSDDAVEGQQGRARRGARFELARVIQIAKCVEPA